MVTFFKSFFFFLSVNLLQKVHKLKIVTLCGLFIFLSVNKFDKNIKIVVSASLKFWRKELINKGDYKLL